MKKYIIESSKRYKKVIGSSIHGRPVQVIHDFVNDIDIEYVSKQIENLIPQNMARYFEGVYVGDFDFFKTNNRNFNAMHQDGVIYATNTQDNEKDLIDDIIHEIAHTLEADYGDLVYGDNALEKEFLAKRKMLYQLVDKKKNLMDFLDPDYSAEFDNYLYKQLGYNYINVLASGLFYSPYAITALKEYWANGFENFFLGDRRKLKELSPVLYNKIVQIIELNEEPKNEY